MTVPGPLAPPTGPVVPQPFHRWAINEDPAAPDAHTTSDGKPDHCLTCGVIRYPLSTRFRLIAEGPCRGPYHRPTS